MKPKEKESNKAEYNYWNGRLLMCALPCVIQIPTMKIFLYLWQNGTPFSSYRSSLTILQGPHKICKMYPLIVKSEE